MQRLKGICPVLPTPFLPDSEIDFASLERLTGFVLRAGCSGVAVLGVASEYWKLTEAERGCVIGAAARAADGTAPVVAGAGGDGERVAAHYARQAESAGASILMVMPPLLFRLSENAIVDYYGAISNACGLPIMIQDTSALGVNQMSVPLLMRLGREVERVAYAKIETLPAGPKTTAVQQCTGLEVFSGNGALNMLDALDRGVSGVMPGADLAPWFVRIWNHYQQGRPAEAEAAHRAILPLLALECQSAEAFVAIVKQVLFLRGLISSPAVRPPSAYQLDDIAARQIAAWATEFTEPE
jgi:dihydrodipicolinate synthase/N-acetylneuraminate lyase